MITFTHRVDNVLTDVDSIVLSDPSGTYGLRRSSTGDVVVVDGVAMTRVSEGTYTFDTDALGLYEDIVYDYWIEVVYDLETNRYQRFLTGTGDPVESTSLRFVCIQDGEYQILNALPKLSSPTDTYGVQVIDTGDIVVANDSSFDVSGSLYTTGFGYTETSHKYRYYVEVVIDDVTYHIPRTTQYQTSAMLCLGRYTNSLAVEQRYGADNVHQWLALDNGDECVDYAMRAYQFIREAEDAIDYGVRGAYIAGAFTDGIPPQISALSSTLAGVLMYEARGVEMWDPNSGKAQHRLQYQLNAVNTAMKQLKYGQLRLTDLAAPISTPAFYTGDDVTENVGSSWRWPWGDQYFPVDD